MNQKELSLAQHRDPKPREGTVAVLEFPLASLESILTGYPLGSTTNLIPLVPHLQVILETRRRGRAYGRTLTLPSIGANLVGFR